MSWVGEELAASDFGDGRLTGRLLRLVDQLSRHPGATIPQACGSSAQAKAAYRFWNNPAVASPRILQPHAEQTARRAAAYSVVLAIQDTTEINLSGHQKTAGLGHLGTDTSRGLYVHTLLAASPDGVPLGVLHQEVWARPVEELGKRKQRNSKPVAEKESQRWLDGVAAAEAALCGHPQVVMVADREADIYDLFAMPRSPRMDLLVRAYHWERRVEHPAKYLADAIQQNPPRGEVEVTLPRADGRPPRGARLTLRWCRLILCEPANYLGEPAAQPVEICFLWAHEEHPPAGQTPISWLLATTLPIESLEDALRVLGWYACRWLIERFHFVLKSGCHIEQRELETAERMERAIATFSVVAWHLLWLTYEARQTPDAPCTGVLETDQWKVLHLATQPRQPLPLQPPTLQQAVRWIAQLGGFLARTHDGNPGVKTLWRGWCRLEDLTSGYRLSFPQQSNPPPASSEDCG